MDSQRDFLVGLFILVTAGIIVGTLLVTSDIGVARNELYLRVATAEDLTSDTRVLLQGLEVGRVRQIQPVRDSVSRRITFVARLAVQERFPNGTELALPVGTRALITQPTPIAAPVVNLVLPDGPARGPLLEPGDTLVAERARSALDQLGEIATRLQDELAGVLDDTRTLMQRTNATLQETQGLLATNGPLVREVLERLASSLERTEGVLADVGPRVGPLHDSLTATLGDARQLLARLDTVVSTARGIAVDNESVIREIAESLRRSTQVLQHFADQVSRRPTRLLTGVTPPPDTVRNDR